MITNTYSRLFTSIIRWIVSNCVKSPGRKGYGRSWWGWNRFQGLLFFMRPCRSIVLRTELIDTLIPSSFRCSCTTSLVLPFLRRISMILLTTSSFNCFAWRLGRDDSVGIEWYPYTKDFLTHFTITLWLKPKCRATFLVLHPLRTSCAASRLMRGMCGFDVYGIWIHPKWLGDSKLLGYYDAKNSNTSIHLRINRFRNYRDLIGFERRPRRRRHSEHRIVKTPCHHRFHHSAFICTQYCKQVLER